MNIFVLDLDPAVAASSQCDRHVVKMVLESTQLLFNLYDAEVPYKRTHYNHPCSIWVRQSAENAKWLVAHAQALSKEYTKRYSKVHKCQEHIDWIEKTYATNTFPAKGLTPFAQAMPEELRELDPVSAYRRYYIEAKARIAAWKKGTPAPYWWPNEKTIL